jgi:hypothetical protein
MRYMIYYHKPTWRRYAKTMRKTIRLLSLAAGSLLMLSVSCEKVEEPPSCSDATLIELDILSDYKSLFVQMNSKKDSLGLNIQIPYRDKDKDGNVLAERKVKNFDNIYLIVNPNVIPLLENYYKSNNSLPPVTFGEKVSFEYRFAEKSEIPVRRIFWDNALYIPPPSFDASKMKFIYITKICNN